MQAEATLGHRQCSRDLVDRLGRLRPALFLAVSRGLSVALQLLMQVCVGALAGAGGLGVLQLFTSWTCIAGEILARGLPVSAMRSAAVHFREGRAAPIRADLRHAGRMILRTWLPPALVLLVAFGIGTRSTANDPAVSEYALIAVAVILAAPLFSLLRLMAEVLKGADAPLAAITLESLLPAASVLLACAFCWVLGKPVTTSTLLVAGIAGFAVSLQGLWTALRRRLRAVSTAAAIGSVPVEHNDTLWLWANSVLTIVYLHLPFLVMPWYVESTGIGVYAVANKLIGVITTLLILQAAVFGPAFARAAAVNDLPNLWLLLRRTQWISTVVFVPLTLGLLLAHEPLAALFHLQPGALAPFLLIMAAGHLVNALTGLPGILLNMAGGAVIEMKTLLATIALSAALSPLVGPTYGATGLACVFAASIAIKNLASYLAAVHHLRQRKEST